MGDLGKLAGQTMVYGISNVLVWLMSFILTPYLTRIMDRSDYGIVTEMYAWIPFLLVVLTMGMESGYFRFAGKAQGESGKRTVFATAWGAVSLVSLAFMVLVLVLKPQIASVMGYANHQSWIWIVGAIISFDTITAIPYARLREQGRAGRYVTVRAFSVLIAMLFTVFFYTVLPRLAESGVMASIYDPGFGPGYVLVANLISSAAVLLMLLPSCGSIWPRIDGLLFRKMLLFSLPLLVSGVAGTANEFIDRQMIKYIMPADISTEALGLYGAVLKLGVIMNLFTQMYRLGAEPFFLAEFKRKEDFKSANAAAMKYYLMVSVLIFLAVALYGDILALLLLGKDFREGVFILPVVLISNMLSGVVLQLSFWYKQMGRTKFAIYVTGTGLVFTITFNIMLIPVLGYYGAALARLVCEVVMVVLSYALNQKHYPIPYDLKRIGEYILLGIVLYVAGILGGEYLPVWWSYAANFALVCVFMIYAVKRERIDVSGLLKSILKRR